MFFILSLFQIKLYNLLYKSLVSYFFSLFIKEQWLKECRPSCQHSLIII